MTLFIICLGSSRCFLLSVLPPPLQAQPLCNVSGLFSKSYPRFNEIQQETRGLLYLFVHSISFLSPFKRNGNLSIPPSFCAPPAPCAGFSVAQVSASSLEFPPLSWGVSHCFFLGAWVHLGLPYRLAGSLSLLRFPYNT